MDSRFRRGLALCFVGIAILLLVLAVASSPQPNVQLVAFAVFGLFVVVLGAVFLAGDRGGPRDRA
jgi:membrane protein implicated in regulation of membrane protease activity